MGIQAAPEIKFALIREATLLDNNLLKISKIANVSRSGYYNWCASLPTRQAREDMDRKDFALILEAYRYRGYDKGVRGIHMRLLHYPGVIMNVKKFRRLMRKYGLRCAIRKANPYRRMAKALATGHVPPMWSIANLSVNPVKSCLQTSSTCSSKTGDVLSQNTRTS